MKNFRYLALSALLVGGLFSCTKDAVRESDQQKPGVPEVPVDFTKYISIGNSITFGYADGAAYKEAQESSFPSILAKSLNTDMKQALVNAGGGTGYMYLSGIDPGTGMPIIGKETPSDGLTTKFLEPINNMGVPGIRAVDMGLPGYGAANPFMGRLIDNSKLASTKYVDIVGEALSDATFATFWLGNNDILGFASTGGAYGEMGDASSPAYRMSGLPEVSIFTLNYKFMTDLLVEKRAILANIPPIEATPFFTTVGPQVYGGIVMDPNNPYILDANSAAMLNEIYKMAGYTTDEDALFVEGQNFPAFLLGKAGGNKVRQLVVKPGSTDIDYVTLTFIEKIGDMSSKGYGFINAIEYPNELDFLTQGAALKLIGEALTAVDALIAGGAGANTIDQVVGAGFMTAEEGARLKGGLKLLGLSDAQINAMTMDQIKAALDGAKAQTMQAFIAAATAAQLDPTNPESPITASERLANPITTEFVLDIDESMLVKTKTTELNGVIKMIADSNQNWILMDANSMMFDIMDGVVEDGVSLDARYIEGNFFSLDGIHLTPKGYAYTAKKMAQAINSKWEQNLSLPNVSEYRGVKIQVN